MYGCLDRLRLQSSINAKQQLQRRLQQLVFEAVCLKKGSFLSSITVSQPDENMSHQPEVTDAISEECCSTLVVSFAVTCCSSRTPLQIVILLWTVNISVCDWHPRRIVG